jgi:hypothetical protein
MSSYPIGIVGESFDNDDGTSRQREIARCSVGEPISLERDPLNKYDSNCIKVVSARGIQIGNIGRDDSWICERLDRGAFIDARIMSVAQGAGGKLGAVICVRTSYDDQWLEDRRPNAAQPSGCSLVLLGMWLPLAIGLIAAVGGSRLLS